MSANLNKQTDDLRILIGQLKQRCLEAENRVSELQGLLAEQQSHIEKIENEKSALDVKYQSLQAGMTATGSNPENVQQLKALYLAMVSELDACIAKLQHG